MSKAVLTSKELVDDVTWKVLGSGGGGLAAIKTILQEQHQATSNKQQGTSNKQQSTLLFTYNQHHYTKKSLSRLD